MTKLINLNQMRSLKSVLNALGPGHILLLNINFDYKNQIRYAFVLPMITYLSTRFRRDLHEQNIDDILLTFTFFCLVEVTHSLSSVQNANISDTSDPKQAKRDLSISYSAADIGSKEGTHIKTITVIKNIVGKKDKQIKVDPKQHKDENWGSIIRDNFDEYGKIPEIPDIDELIGYKKHKKTNEASDKEKPMEEKKVIKEKSPEMKMKSDEKTDNAESNGEAVAESDKKEVIEKIPGDVELINTETANLQLRSQSLPQFSGQNNITVLKRKVEIQGLPEITKYLTQYSTPQHSVRQYFFQGDKKLNLKDGLKKSAKIIVQPCDRAYPAYSKDGYPILTVIFSGITINNGDNSGSVVKVTTPSGRTYDVPLPTTTSKPPYIAPSLKKTNNFNSSSDSNNNSNNINNNINIGRPAFNFNNFLGTQPVNIPVNQPVEIPINNPDPTTAAPPPTNATTLFPANIPFGVLPNQQQPINLIPGIPGVNQGYNPNYNQGYNPGYNHGYNQGYNPLYKGYNPHGNVPNYGFVNNNQQPGNNQFGIQGNNPLYQQPANQQPINQQPVNQQPINQDTSAVTFPNLADNPNNGFSITNTNNYNNPGSGGYTSFVPTSNKIKYAIPYTNLPKRSNNENFVPKQKGRSRGLRY
ncbi:putative uncharacterized protein DDB_G0286901 [Condylostylus longicornis]|uniref:putative uncharacterized protein DDB_G0286901 n=1 Tax=Condylostylus longicornis TaxID=2530218 RepID=UPI00244DA361|nr:putative uncharacterized protein DDB_G0286901 [Condylostylus longicornis]